MTTFAARRLGNNDCLFPNDTGMTEKTVVISLRSLAVLLLPTLFLGACDGDGVTADDPIECGLPSPEPNTDADLIPDYFLPEGTELVRAQAERGGYLAMINIQLGVQDALEDYHSIVSDNGFEIIQEDNEGFEAEIYLRKRKQLAAIQIRRSQCDDASVIFINLVDEDQLGGGLPSPTPSA